MDEKFNRYNRYSQENEDLQPKDVLKKESINISSEQLRDEYAEREKIFRARLEERYGVNGNKNNIDEVAYNQKNTKKSTINKDLKHKKRTKKMPNKKSKLRNSSNSATVALRGKKFKDKKIKRAKRRKKLIWTLILVLIIGICGIFIVNKFQEGAWLKNNFMVEPVTELDYDKVRSNYVYLYNLDEEKMTAGKNENKKMYPASLTKMMAAIVTIEEIGDPGNLNNTVIVPKYITDKMSKENASVAGFVGGEEVSYMDLLYGAMLPSGGDACLTIADKLFGNEENMVEVMNKKAESLNMNNTHFTNTIGLHDDNHYSTAKDMCILLEYGLENKIFKKIISTEEYTSSVTKEHPKGILLENSLFEKIEKTKVLEEKQGSLIEDEGYYADNKGYYDNSVQYQKKYVSVEKYEDRYLNENDIYIMGGKTGYTELAHLCLASYGVVDGEEYILVTGQAMGTPDGEPFNIYDALYIYGQIHEAHLNQKAYIDDKLWRKFYYSLFKKH